MASTQTALPGQSGVATASELDQFGNPFTISDPDSLAWSTDGMGITVAATGDGTPTAKVVVAKDAAVGSFTITFSDPAAPNIPVAAATLVVAASPSVAASGAVDLGPFA